MEGVKDSRSLQSPGARSEALAVVGELHLQQEWLGRAKAAKVTCCTLLHIVAHCCTWCIMVHIHATQKLQGRFRIFGEVRGSVDMRDD